MVWLFFRACWKVPSAGQRAWHCCLLLIRQTASVVMLSGNVNLSRVRLLPFQQPGQQEQQTKSQISECATALDLQNQSFITYGAVAQTHLTPMPGATRLLRGAAHLSRCGFSAAILRNSR